MLSVRFVCVCVCVRDGRNPEEPQPKTRTHNFIRPHRARIKSDAPSLLLLSRWMCWCAQRLYGCADMFAWLWCDVSCVLFGRTRNCSQRIARIAAKCAAKSSSYSIVLQNCSSKSSQIETDNRLSVLVWLDDEIMLYWTVLLWTDVRGWDVRFVVRTFPDKLCEQVHWTSHSIVARKHLFKGSLIFNQLYRFIDAVRIVFFSSSQYILDFG